MARKGALAVGFAGQVLGQPRRRIAGVDGQVLSIGTPRRMSFVRVPVRELVDVTAVRVHYVDVIRPLAVALECDPLPVGAPRHRIFGRRGAPTGSGSHSRATARGLITST